MGLGSRDEETGKIRRGRLNRKCRWSHSTWDRWRRRTREGEKKGVMKVTPRLIHTQRQNSPKRHRDAKRLAQLTTSHILPAVPPSTPPPKFLCPLTSPSSWQLKPPPTPYCDPPVPPVAMSTTPPPPALRLACIHSDSLPVLISS